MIYRQTWNEERDLKLIITQDMTVHKIVTDSSPSPLSSPSRREEA